MYQCIIGYAGNCSTAVLSACDVSVYHWIHVCVMCECVIEDADICSTSVLSAQPPPHHNRFTALFLGQHSAGAKRELLDFMVQGKINRGRNTDHPDVCHSIRTNQCLPPPFPHFSTGRMPFLPPTNSVKALKDFVCFVCSRTKRSKKSN